MLILSHFVLHHSAYDFRKEEHTEGKKAQHRGVRVVRNTLME